MQAGISAAPGITPHLQASRFQACAGAARETNFMNGRRQIPNIHRKSSLNAKPTLLIPAPKKSQVYTTDPCTQ
ncbi:hypothetical protein RRG08_020635 [Elysia crispata]|uniref:Uncharacterized protein n=1 Tax=Elysia crispata TaxID=231223 RepID=A0AAE1DW38_9GAST|nr:hypothetical protein RRG08_020635 [Elysia crispata]